MSQQPTRSLRHEYALYVEEEIENYKESVPRSVLLGIGDEAVSSLSKQPQFALTELLLCEEVDRIIFRRLRLPTYQTWRRRRLKIVDELRRPERIGFRSDHEIARALTPTDSGAHVLVAGVGDEDSALYFAANGCEVTTLSAEAHELDRVLHAAQRAGLAGRVHGQVADLASWMPERQLSAVVVSPSALAGLSATQRAKVIALLQSVTLDGGVHLVRAIVDGKRSLTLDELRSRYTGWMVSVESADDQSSVFMARKQAS